LLQCGRHDEDRDFCGSGWDVGLHMVWRVAQAVRIPVVGMGGIVTAEDALEYLIAGAAAVQVGSAHFIDPKAAVKIVEGIRGYLETNSLQTLSPLIGSLKVKRELS